MKLWFPIKHLQMKVGEVTDTFGNYVELFEPERGEWYIRHIDKCIEAKKESEAFLRHVLRSKK